LVKKRSTSFDWSIENNEEFQRKIDSLGRATADFRIPFRLISSDFYRSQKQLFGLKSRGLYDDIEKRTKAFKLRHVGFIYPILKLTGDLADSTLGPSNFGSVYFISRQSLSIGTSIDYGKYHQSDKPRSVIPQRKFIFITGGAGDESADSGINGRRERWTNIIDDHVKQLITGRVL
jgi:phage gpG-like protein